LGISIGIIVRDWPKFRIIYELKITDIISNILTLGVGIFVPFLIKKIIDDTRSVKTILVNEIDNYSKSMEPIFDMIKQCYDNKKISSNHKEFITFTLELCEQNFLGLKESILENFSTQLNKEIKSIEEQQTIIWKKLTGNSISSQKIRTIDLQTFQQVCQLKEEMKIRVTALKTKIHKI
jgi:hypothetical protein